MGCASSAPLVQGGLDGAKQKAKAAAAEAAKLKDEAIDKMKDMGEEVKETIIELKDEAEDKIESIFSSGKESAEEAAGEATKAAEEAAKMAEEEAAKMAEAAEEKAEEAAEEAEATVEEAKEDAELKLEEVTDELGSTVETLESDLEKKTTEKTEETRPIDKIVFIDIRSDGKTTIVEELVIGGGDVDFSSRASTGRASSSERGFPPSGLEDIRDRIEEDMKVLGDDFCRRPETSRTDASGMTADSLEEARKMDTPSPNPKPEKLENIETLRTDMSEMTADSLEEGRKMDTHSPDGNHEPEVAEDIGNGVEEGIKMHRSDGWATNLDEGIKTPTTDGWTRKTPSPDGSSKLEGLERLVAARADLAEAVEDVRGEAVETASDLQLQEILDEEKELKEGEDFRIQVGCEEEASHSPSITRKTEENNNDEKNNKNDESDTKTIEDTSG